MGGQYSSPSMSGDERNHLGLLAAIRELLSAGADTATLARSKAAHRLVGAGQESREGHPTLVLIATPLKECAELPRQMPRGFLDDMPARDVGHFRGRTKFEGEFKLFDDRSIVFKADLMDPGLLPRHIEAFCDLCWRVARDVKDGVELDVRGAIFRAEGLSLGGVEKLKGYAPRKLDLDTIALPVHVFDLRDVDFVDLDQKKPFEETLKRDTCDAFGLTEIWTW